MKQDYTAYGAWFRKNLRKLRRDREWSQAFLAEKAGLGLQHYQKIEYGTIKSPSLESLYNIAQALNLTLGELLVPPETSKSSKKT